MKGSFKQRIVIINITIAFLVMILGVVQYKITQYNYKIGELNEDITGKVTSALFINFDLISEGLEIVEHSAFLLHDKVLEAKVKEDQILKKRSDIILNYIEVAEISTGELNKIIEKITKNSNTSFLDKYNELRMLYEKYKGSIQPYFDTKYREKRSMQNKLEIASFIQIIVMVALFILSSLVSLLAFKNEEPVKDVPKKMRK